MDSDVAGAWRNGGTKMYENNGNIQKYYEMQAINRAYSQWRR